MITTSDDGKESEAGREDRATEARVGPRVQGGAKTAIQKEVEKAPRGTRPVPAVLAGEAARGKCLGAAPGHLCLVMQAETEAPRRVVGGATGGSGPRARMRRRRVEVSRAQ